MPIGHWATFGECVGAQKRKGYSDESANKICGSIEQQAASNPELDAAALEKSAVFTECMENALKYYDEETAKRVCGAAKAEYGSSPNTEAGAANPMSFPPKKEAPDSKAESDGGGKFTLSESEGQAVVDLAQGAANAGDPDLAQLAQKVIAFMAKQADMVEESPSTPPMR
jgi:hypothetical protein